MDQELSAGLRVLVADKEPAVVERVSRMLGSLGHDATASAVDLAEATEAIAREDPDVALVVVHDDDEHALDMIEEIHSFSRGPVVALIQDAHDGFLTRAADRGIAAFARDADAEGVQAALDVAVRQHAHRRELERKVQQLEFALDRRAVIERAKGILMERHRIPEREAFDRLRVHARGSNRAVVDVAQGVADGHGLL